MALNSPASRAASTTSRTIFSWIAWPICTAPPLTLSLSALRPRLENVAPCSPSRPVRPPSATIKSPGDTRFSTLSAGTRPTVPQNTSGLAR